MSVKNRILEFIRYKGINKATFEKIVGLSNDAVNKMGDNVRISTLDKISNKFPELDILWLRTGHGEMINKEYSNTEENKNTINNHINMTYSNDNALEEDPENNNKHMNIKDRLQFIVSEKFGGNIDAFAQAINVNSTTVESLFEKDSRKPSGEVLVGITNYLPDLNGNWLLKGIGEPFINSNPIEVLQTGLVSGENNLSVLIKCIQNLSDADRSRAEAEKEHASADRVRAEAERARAEAEKARAESQKDQIQITTQYAQIIKDLSENLKSGDPYLKKEGTNN